MQHNNLEKLLETANKEIKRLTFTESLSIINKEDVVIIDVREESEVYISGVIKNAIHIPRGLLELTLAPNSQTNPIKNINEETFLLDYCAGGYRSALAAKSLKDLGFKNVYNLGGYQEWIDSGGEIQPNT